VRCMYIYFTSFQHDVRVYNMCLCFGVCFWKGGYEIRPIGKCRALGPCPITSNPKKVVCWRQRNISPTLRGRRPLSGPGPWAHVEEESALTPLIYLLTWKRITYSQYDRLLFSMGGDPPFTTQCDLFWKRVPHS